MFRALADGSRRRLLDALLERDGQTLGELCAVLDGMTRFGVAKHLEVLESAGLVISERVGRTKRHQLNAAPIQMVAEGWMARYRSTWSTALADLARRAESGPAPSAIPDPTTFTPRSR